MSRVVRMIARAQTRRRWRAILALTLFVGLAGGVSMALIAGSRRSATRCRSGCSGSTRATP